jgi:hypothetical protein
LVFQGHSQGTNQFPVQVALVMKDGSAYGTILNLSPDQKRYTVNLEDLIKVQSVLLPRPYPTFLPYFAEDVKSERLDLSQVESIQLSIGPNIQQADWGKTFELLFAGVWLE